MKSKLTIIGDGSFGSFLKTLLSDHFEIVDCAESIVLAVPLSAYSELGKKYSDHHLINVCSVQKPSTDMLTKHTHRITSIHPLFGVRTPADKRNSIFTHTAIQETDTWYLDEAELNFLRGFRKVSRIIEGFQQCAI